MNNIVNIMDSPNNLWRVYSRGKYDNDFDFLKPTSSFPSEEVKGRNAVYKFRHKQFTGEYCKRSNLIAFINNIETEIPYKVISMNYYKLMTNKITDLIFGNEITVKTGNVQRDKQIDKLRGRTNWDREVRKAVVYSTIYGDSCIKSYKNGISAFAPTHAFKIVDKDNVSNTVAYVLYQPLLEKENGISAVRYIRFEIHFKGKIYECVREYKGNDYSGTVGLPVSYTYKNRKIYKEGNWYDTGVEDCELVQWLSINQAVDGVYGESLYMDIQDIVTAMEQRLSTAHYELNSLAHPLLIVGMSCIETTESGEYKLKTVNGKYIVTEDRASDHVVTPQSFQQDYKLENSEQMLDQLRSHFYELSEMGRTFLSGEYSGNISEETLTNTIKSAIDKGNRIITELYDSIRDSLYVLCRLNNIDVEKDELTLTFNIGRTDDDKKVAEICKVLSEAKILSKSTLRNRYFGYNEEQSAEEQKLIDIENGINEEIDNSFENIDNQNIENVKEEDSNEN